jgi:hypothetical protein
MQEPGQRETGETEKPQPTHPQHENGQNRGDCKMPTAEDTAIAMLLLQHENEQAAINANAREVTITRSLNPSPPKEKKQPKAKQAVSTATLTYLNGLPQKGTLDAAGFMAAIKVAGRRLNDFGHPYTDQGQVRHDMIRAIASYIGYDPRGNFGAQDIAARAQAMRDLKVVKVTAGPPVLRNASKSIAGYVHGMPDTRAKALSNLRAQGEATLSSIIEHEKAAMDMSRSDNERRLSEGLAKLDRERLSHIHTDIRAMGEKP